MSELRVARNGSKSRGDAVSIKNPLPVALVGLSPDITVVVDQTTTAAASAVALITASATQRAYLNKVIVAGLGATAAAAPTLTIAGLEGEDIVLPIPVPAGATTALTPLVINFDPPLRGALLGDDVTVTLQSFGTGNTRADVIAFGYLNTPNV